MDVSQYLDIFLDETKEHIQNLSDQIMALEENPEDPNTINEIFRAAHTLKGMAGTMGYKRMQTLTHDMENVFSEVRSGKLKAQPEMIDILFNCLDALDEYTQNIQNTADEGTNDNEELIKRLNDLLKSQEEAQGGSEPVKAPENETKKEEAKETDKAEAENKAAGETDEGASSDGKWYDIHLDGSQIHVIQEARKQGMECYGINVVVQDSCLLKAARAFLVFKAIEEKGEIIVSNPSAQDVEDEKFDKDFTLLVLSKSSLDDVMKAASNVSEIANVTGSVIQLEKTKDYKSQRRARPVLPNRPRNQKKPALPLQRLSLLRIRGRIRRVRPGSRL